MARCTAYIVCLLHRDSLGSWAKKIKVRGINLVLSSLSKEGYKKHFTGPFDDREAIVVEI